MSTWHVHTESPVYEAVQKNGLRKYWQIAIVFDPSAPTVFYTRTSHWSELKDGTNSLIQTSEPYEAVPMNIGKANETTSLAQAQLEYAATIKKQRDKKQYMLPGEDRTALIPLPMLAHSFDKHKKKITYPCAAQYKYDGHRMTYMDGKGYTRGGQEHIPEVIAHLFWDELSSFLDGELLLPDMELLQQTASAVKKFQPGLSDTLIYRVYDIIRPDLTFRERYDVLKLVFGYANVPANVQLAPTFNINNEDELHDFFVKAVADGHEGIIVRNWDGMYQIMDRSYDLQKYKPFIEAEYRIVNVVPMGGGSASKLGKFVLEADNGETFEASYKADNETRAQLLINGEQYIGKYAQTRYPNLSERGVPQHGRVVDIRDTKTGGY